LIGTLAFLAIVGAVGWLHWAPVQAKALATAGDEEKTASPELAALHKTGADFVKAFNNGDAKAVATFWTKNAEYIAPDGEAVRGRPAIEKEYAEFFKNNPKATLKMQVDSRRLLGRHTALLEGNLEVQLPGNKEPSVSRSSALLIHEDDGWKLASVREWMPDPNELVSLKDVEWLLGDWVAKGNNAEVRVNYEWDEGKGFIRGHYTLKQDGKATSSGTQIIGKNPAGGLRSWVFDSSGIFGESLWSRDENRWLIEASGTLPDGTEVTAVNLLIPLGKDAFTWQSVERMAAGSPLPDVPPVKVSRVKNEK
jgi:uncharacterized protein (TIGR02246 family)